MALVVCVIGMVASLAASQLQASANRRVLEQRLTRTLAYVAEGVETRLRDYVQVLQGIRGLVVTVGADHITAPQMQRYLESIDSERTFAGARGFGFVRRVPRAEQDAFLRRQPAEQGETYAVRELGPNDGERFLIQLVLPPGRNRVARGLDLASEPNRRAAAVAAMESGAATLTAPITLVQSAGARNRGFLLLLPVYRETDMPSTAQRAKSLIGWTYAPLQLDTVLHGLIDANEDVSVALDDVDEFGTVAVLPHVVQGRQDVLVSRDLSIFGRRWRLALTGGAAFQAQQGLASPGMVFSIGVGITLVLTVLATSVAGVRLRHRQVLTEQAKLAAIVDSSIDAIIGKDLDGRITSWNHGAEMLFGYCAREALGRTVAELLVPPERQYEEMEVLGRLAAGGAVPSLETQRRHRQGHLIDVWMAIAPVRGPDGRVVGVATTVRDITERRAAQEQVRLSNLQLEETVASRTTQLRRLNGLLSSVLDAAAGVAIVATDVEGTITVFNRGAELLLGYRAGDMVGRATPLAFHDAAEVARRAADISAAEGVSVGGMQTFVFYPERDGAETREWTYVRRDGTHIDVSLIVTVIRDHSGRIEGYLGIAVDVTDRKALLDSLREAKERADAASEAKSSFLANMSHEIRTPMNAVLGMLQLLEMTRLDARQQDYASKAGHAARALLRLLNDVLDYSKMNAGKFVLDPHPFELDGLMRDLAAILSGNHGGKPVEVVFDMDPRVPPYLLGDRMRLHQVLTNLAGNALKFTESGSVTVRVGLLAHDGTAVRVRFEVTDTGIGIGPEQRERIFDGFTQAEASISRRFGGTGLGLVLCRHLIELMGGEIHLDSCLGAGSRFWFDLELGEASGPPIASLRPGLRVLVVDDQVEASSALAKMVEGLGWQAEAVCGGREALLRIRQAPANAPFDVVLLDWRMPGLDGLEAARMIRRDLAHPPVVLMVTAYGREMLLDKQAGGDPAPFADVLTKPVTPQLVSEAVLRALEPAVALPPAPQRTRLAGMRLLLVEDNPLNRQVASELLEAEGASVDVAEDGRQGVDYLMHALHLPDAVLMDVQMPVMDGLEATRLIRARLGEALPIIAMTANVSAADQASCFEAGMNDHVDKPVDIERLVAVLRPALDAPRVHARRPDRASHLARFGGNEAIYLRSLDEFAPAAVKLVAQARTAMGAGDRMTALGALHSLKGMAGTIGADDVAAAAAAIESSVRQYVEANKLLPALDACARLVEVSERQLRGTVQAPASHVLHKPPALPLSLSLDELASLLADSDLRALDVVDRLEMDGLADPVCIRLIEQVRALDFAGALSAVTILRERHG